MMRQARRLRTGLLLATALAALPALVGVSPPTLGANADPRRSVELAAVPPSGDPFGDTDLEPVSGPLILRVQKALKSVGFYKGPVDGRMTPETEAAIRAYQKLANLAVDGRVSETLAENIESNFKIKRLLQRLGEARREQLDAARQALLDHPSTRDLITGPVDEVADPTRDPTPCFREPTVRCLLGEASESAKAIPKDELRDWALGELLAAEARAGLAEEAMDTVRRINDPRLIMVALREIAEGQAEAGRTEGALDAVAIIPNARKRLEAYAAIGEIQLRRGETAQARRTVEHLLTELEGLDDEVKRVAFQARAAVIMARAGDGTGGGATLEAAEDLARAQADDLDRGVALRHVASALADLEQTREALAVLSDVTTGSDRTPVLMTAAAAQARSGDAAAALATADSIEEVRYRAVALGRIAVAQAQAGDSVAADTTLELAFAAIDGIKFPYARSYAVSRLALALAEIGRETGVDAFDEAVTTAERIQDDQLRAQTLWTIATERRRAGDGDGALATEDRARRASEQIKSSLSQVWMFSEIASFHAAAAESEPGWRAFRNGLEIAEAIHNPWGRARALAKLAATLIQLVELPAAAPSSP